MSVTAGIARLDQMAARFPNRITADIDLSGYMDEAQRHRIKPANEFADEVGQLIFTPASETGRALPWPSFHNKFAFRPHEVTIWTGYKGHGKSAFLSQMLDEAMVRGDKVFAISPEFRPARLIERMIYQRFGTRNVTVEQLAEWFRWAANVLWIYDAQASLNADDVVALCRFAVDQFKVDHVLIDSLMKVGIAPDDYGRQKQFVDRVQSIAHNNPVHIHLVAHARKGHSDEQPPRLHDIKGTSEIADMAENVMVVWRNKPKEKAQSMMDASKDAEPDAIAIVEAQRNADGWVGAVPMFFNRSSMTYTEGNPACPI